MISQFLTKVPELKDDQNKMFVLHNCSDYLMATLLSINNARHYHRQWILQTYVQCHIWSVKYVHGILIKIEPKTRKTFSQSIGGFMAKTM
jgi:hypothetical protein